MTRQTQKPKYKRESQQNKPPYHYTCWNCKYQWDEEKKKEPYYCPSCKNHNVTKFSNYRLQEEEKKPGKITPRMRS